MTKNNKDIYFYFIQLNSDNNLIISMFLSINK